MYKQNKNLGFEEIKLLTEATFRIIDSAKQSTDACNITAEINFLCMFVETLVYRSLNIKNIDDKSKKEFNLVVNENYRRLKFGVQEAVALGYQTALETNTNVPCEFYCTIGAVDVSKAMKVTN